MGIMQGSNIGQPIKRIKKRNYAREHSREIMDVTTKKALERSGTGDCCCLVSDRPKHKRFC